MQKILCKMLYRGSYNADINIKFLLSKIDAHKQTIGLEYLKAIG